MTIETKSSQNTARPTSGADAHHAKNKPGATGNSGQGAPGGFMAILASLDTSELAVVATPVTTGPALQAYAEGASALAATDGNGGSLKPALRGGPDGLRGLATDGDASGALDDANGKLLQDIPSDASATNLLLPTDTAATALPVVTELPPQASALLAQSLQWTVASTISPDEAKARDAGAAAPDIGLGVRLLNSSEAPQRTQIPGDLDEQFVKGPIAKDGMGSGVRLPSSSETPQRTQIPVDLDVQSTKESIAKGGKLYKDGAARPATVSATLAMSADITSQSDSRASVFLAAKITGQSQTPVTTALAMANTLAPTRRDESTCERSVFRSTVPDGGAMAQTYAPTAAGVQTHGAVEPPAPTDMYVAEKVAYWISNDVQNAEMKLDGIGTEPVEVSIRMQGNEAHIAFRTDEILARSALESASVHLKDLLQREGLVLSGVSVGTSGAGDSGDQERRSRQGLRQSVVVSQQPAGGDRITGTGRATRGALDLFV